MIGSANLKVPLFLKWVEKYGRTKIGFYKLLRILPLDKFFYVAKSFQNESFSHFFMTVVELSHKT